MSTALESCYGSFWQIGCHLRGCPTCKPPMQQLSRSNNLLLLQLLSCDWVIICKTKPVLLKTLQQERPGMPEGISPSLAFIVQSCWMEDPNMRPSFSQIIRLLNEFLLTLSPPPPPPQPEPDTSKTNGGAITEFSSRAKGKIAFIRQLFAAKRNRNS